MPKGGRSTSCTPLCGTEEHFSYPSSSSLLWQIRLQIVGQDWANLSCCYVHCHRQWSTRGTVEDLLPEMGSQYNLSITPNLAIFCCFRLSVMKFRPKCYTLYYTENSGSFCSPNQAELSSSTQRACVSCRNHAPPVGVSLASPQVSSALNAD